MKKIAILILSSVLMVSCVNETKDNTPAFQARLNSGEWKAKEFSASVGSDGRLTLKAIKGGDLLELKTTSAAIGTFKLGTTNTANEAHFSRTLDSGIQDFHTSVVPGPVYTYDLTNPGSGYAVNHSSLTTNLTSGSAGVGLVIDVEEVSASGAITKAKVKARGANYKAGDQFSIQGGANNAKGRVSNVQQSNGLITIEKIENGTITGKFQLNAVNNQGDIVTFAEGVFYRIPF